MFGVGLSADRRGLAIVSIDETTGKITTLNELKYEAVAAELSSIDQNTKTYYVIGLNNTGTYKHPALLGFALPSGKLTIEVPLPFLELGLVGVSQSVDVDPITGNVVMCGLVVDSPGSKPAHQVLMYDAKTKKLSEKIVDIPGSGISVLGASTTIDNDGVAYFTFARNISAKVSVQIASVPTRGADAGTYAWLEGEHHFGTMDFDTKTKKIVGVVGGDRQGHRFIGDYDTVTKKWYTKPTQLANAWTGGMMAIASFNSAKRALSLLLQKGTPPKPFTPSTSCTPACKDSLCCTPPSGTASCFANVTDCAEIPSGGGGPNMTDPMRLAQFNVDTGALISDPDLCLITKCPWSLESLN